LKQAVALRGNTSENEGGIPIRSPPTSAIEVETSLLHLPPSRLLGRRMVNAFALNRRCLRLARSGLQEAGWYSPHEWQAIKRPVSCLAVNTPKMALQVRIIGIELGK
jgi:hypothetical protein